LHVVKNRLGHAAEILAHDGDHNRPGLLVELGEAQDYLFGAMFRRSGVKHSTMEETASGPAS